MSLPGTLEQVWYEEASNPAVCCKCWEVIEPEPLIRTFSFGSPHTGRTHSRTLDIGADSSLLLFDRHLRCVTQDRFVAISHVWNTVISRVQYEKDISSSTRERIWRRILDVSQKLHHAILDGSGTELELWFDYISVPQWTETYKNRILAAIPQIYASATFTAVHLADLDPRSIHLLKEGTSTRERIEGITGICNVSWLRRVWTATEFVRSAHVRLIDKNYQLHTSPDDPLFFYTMMNVWAEEHTQHSVHELEHIAGHGTNLVPWNVSALFYISELPAADFAHAFAMLSSRGCLQDMDFMHALNGIVNSQANLTEVSDHHAAHMSIARSCLENGDYSPLLMTPELGEGSDPRDNEDNAGVWALNDVFTWGMGSALDPPTHAKDLCFDSSDSTSLTLTLARMGAVTMLQANSPLDGNTDRQFIHAATFVLDLTGPNVDDFITSLGTRLYNEDASEIRDYVHWSKGHEWLEDLLRRRYYDHPGELWPESGKDCAVQLLDCLGLDDHRGGARSESAVEYQNAHGNTIHLHNRNHMIRVRCGTCHHETAMRAALFRTAEYVQGATAYRIPGLRYYCTRDDGVGVLVKNETVVGRLLWAVPSCPCSQLSVVRLKMPKLPRRRPLRRRE